MKKLLFVPLTFISILFFSFTVHAEYLPPVLPDTSVLPDFLMTVGQYEMLQNQGFYTESSDINRVNQMVNNRTIQQSLQNRYVDNSNLPQLSLFYDSNGNLVNQDNTYTVFGTSDITNYCFVADKTTGEILMCKDSYNNLVSTLNAGKQFDQVFSAVDVPTSSYEQGILLDEYFDAKNNYMVVYSNQISEEDAEFLESYEFYATWHSDEKNYTCYVPNACTSNTLVISTNEFSRNVYNSDNVSDLSQLHIFAVTNNPSEVFYSSSGTDNYLIQDQKYFFGYQFNYISKINVGYMQFYYGGYVDFNIPTAQQYNQYRELSDSAVYIQPAENSGVVNNTYNFTYVTENPLNPNPSVNNTYNNTYPTNYYNYPVTNNFNVPDLSNGSDTYVNNIYNYYTSPNTNTSAGELDTESLSDNIPIISNLKYRFPFSIPFDLFEMAKSFNVERETPIIDFRFFIAGIDYEAVIHFDLSEWDDMFSLFRTLELILFIVGLAVFSYDHFFGT